MSKFNGLHEVEKQLLLKGLDALTKFTEDEFHTIDNLRDELKEAHTWT